MGPAAVPVSVVRAVRDAGSARQSGPLRICILVLGCRRSSITHPSHVQLMSHHSQSRQSKQSWHVEQSLHATAPPHAPDDRHTDTPRTMGGYRARSAIAPTANTSPHRWGEAESHTHRSSADTLHVSARSMWPALSPRSYLAFSTAACGHAPRRAGLGGRPRSRTRCGHARWLRWLRA